MRMINLRLVYRRAEEHTALFAVGVFFVLALLLILQSVFSPGFVFTGIAGLAAVYVAFTRPTWILGFLALYLPFESFVLKFLSDDVYVFARYGSELLIYVLAGVVLLRLLSGKTGLRQTPIDLPFILFVVTLLASALIHWVPAGIVVLGMRQILRFMIVFFLVIYLKPKKDFFIKLLYALLAVGIFQSMLGILQSFVGESLDLFLLASERRTLGAITLTEGVQQFWDPGSRVFATLGRYDRLGNFLYILLLIGTGFLFTKQKDKTIQQLLPWLFLLGLPTLILTFSRSSWFAFLLGFLFIGLLIKKDRRVGIALAVFVITIMSYVAVSGLSVSLITEGPGQTLTERFYESFSLARWRGEYYGIGRVFWYVHTPADVVAGGPIFGWGPGQFGGGAAAALHNTAAYEAVGLPFGVFGTQGFIDNNWFSLWGEAGTLGLIFYIWLMVTLFRYAVRTYRETADPFTRALALGFAALVIAISFNAFTSTIFEIRTVAFYFWLLAGAVVVLSESSKKKKV